MRYISPLTLLVVPTTAFTPSIVPSNTYRRPLCQTNTPKFGCSFNHQTTNELSNTPFRKYSGEHRSLHKTNMAANLASGIKSVRDNPLSVLDFSEVPSDKVIKAVEKAKYRATAADVASFAGIDIYEANKELVKLASLTGGSGSALEVSADGDMVYSFPRNLRAALAAESSKVKAREAWQKVKPVLFYLARLGFGVSLLVSIGIIFTSIFVISTASSQSRDREDDDRGYGGGGGGFGYFFRPLVWFGPSPFDFLFWNPYYGSYNPYYGYGQPPPRPDGYRYDRRKDPEDISFLEAVFSYVFGDGDPNYGLEQQQIAAAAAVIRENGGAVTAEQVAPVLTPNRPPPGPNDGEFGTANVDESFMLPLLTLLEGTPEVTEEGDIVYVFPSLQTTAVGAEEEDEPIAALSSNSGQLDTDLVVEISESDPDLSTTLFDLYREQEGGLKVDTRELMVLAERRGIQTSDLSERKELVGRIVSYAEDLRASGGRGGSSLSASYADGVGGSGFKYEGGPMEERVEKFSVAPRWKTITAGVLGVVNLGGALYLSNMLGQIFAAAATGSRYAASLPGWIFGVKALMPFLLAYAVLFNAVPAVRYFRLQKKNEAVEERNALRSAWYRYAVAAPTEAVRRKAEAAKRLGQRIRRVGRKDIVYRSDQGLEEQNEANGANGKGGPKDDLFADFDRRMKE